VAADDVVAEVGGDFSVEAKTVAAGADFDEGRLNFRRKYPVETLLVETIRGIETREYFLSRIPSLDCA